MEAHGSKRPNNFEDENALKKQRTEDLKLNPDKPNDQKSGHKTNNQVYLLYNYRDKVESTLDDTEEDDENNIFEKKKESPVDESMASYSNFEPPKASISTQISETIMQPPIAVDPVNHEEPPFDYGDSQKENEPVERRYSMLNYQILQNRYEALKRQMAQLRELEKQKAKAHNKQLKQQKQLLDKLENIERQKAENKQNNDRIQLMISERQEDNTKMEKVIYERTLMREKMAEQKVIIPEISHGPKIDIMLATSTNLNIRHPIRIQQIISAPLKNFAALNDEVLKSQIMLEEFLLLSDAKKESIEECLPFLNKFIPMISLLCRVIEAEERRKARSQTFRSQSQILEEEFNVNDREPPEDFYQKRLANESKFLDEIQSPLDCSATYPNDRNPNKRVIIEILSKIAENSFTMSSLIALHETTTGLDRHETILEMLSNATKKYIIPSNGLTEYLGLSDAMAALAWAISLHYTKFDNHEAIDNILAKYFNSLIMIVLNNSPVLVKLTQFIINISRYPDCDRLLTKLCKNAPIPDRKECKLNDLIKIPLDGCELQVLFLLLVNVFPAHEDVPDHRLYDLFKLTENLNAIGFHFFSHGPSMKCLQNSAQFEVDSCKCLYGLIRAITTLNMKMIEQRNKHYGQRHCQQIKNSIQNYLNLAVNFLNYVRDLKPFQDMKMVLMDLIRLYRIVKDGLNANPKPPYIPEISKYFDLERINVDLDYELPKTDDLMSSPKAINEQNHEEFYKKMNDNIWEYFQTDL